MTRMEKHSMATPISVGILGMGSCLPAHVRGNDYWEGKLRPRDEEQRRRDFVVVERTAEGTPAELPEEIRAAMAAYSDDLFRGARLRHVLGDDEEVADMEAEAARRALADAALDPQDIDLLMVHSPVPDAVSPYNPPTVQARCGLTAAAAFSLDLGCASFHPQLLAAAGMIRAGFIRKALLVMSFAGSRIMDEHRPDSVGLGDAAAALVVGEVPAGYGLLGHYMRTDGRMRDGVVIAPVANGSPQRCWWRAPGPFRLSSFDIAVGKQLGVRSTEFCREACLGALAASGLTLADVSFFICNQSLGWFVDACRRGLGLAAEQTLDTFAEVANIAAAAIPFNLERAHRTGRLRDGDIVLIYSPSAGFTRAASVYRWIAPERLRPTPSSPAIH
ncbi:MAG: 3-oxoacyl-[acyl-carrier-protein] synthase III C-terminal domain-containing protein [Myxococcales bacterium]|nr:hypothetical protein [Myxococcota bacterium]MDW8282966.1 3-oxoacyl-[acyl-carrier-protein] synthase III C-terminal domain-containing protein [Myxococcales bacterium]